MQDLNDFYYFAAVVTHRGFASAARALGVPKSSLSRRIARLEARLGVRLLERSSRRFGVTELGGEFYERSRAVLADAEAAEDAVARVRAEPRGLVRASGPPGCKVCSPVRCRASWPPIRRCACKSWSPTGAST